MASLNAPTWHWIEWTSRSAVAILMDNFLESPKFALLVNEISDFIKKCSHFGRLSLLTIATTRSYGRNGIFVNDTWWKAFGSARIDSVEIENQLRKMRFGAFLQGGPEWDELCARSYSLLPRTLYYFLRLCIVKTTNKSSLLLNIRPFY